MVVTAAFVSDKGLPVYQELADYLAGKLGHGVDVVSGVSYSEANRLLGQGVIDIGFVCGLPYTHQHAEGKVRLLAVPVMAMGQSTFADVPGYRNMPGKYYSYTIVHKDAALDSWADLKGRSYAYNDQTSNSGYNVPRYRLLQLGANSWEDYFSEIAVSSSHEESIRLVARGVIDASSVNSLVLDYDRHIGDPDALNVKVIEVMLPGGMGIPPVVVNTKVSQQTVDRLQQALLNMHQDPAGRRILDRALIRRFAEPDDADYDGIRHMEQAAQDAGFRDHRP